MLYDVQADFPAREVDIGMEYLAPEYHFGRSDGVLRAQNYVHIKNIALVRGLLRPFDIGLPIQQVPLVEHEQKVGEGFPGRVEGLLHESLFIHVAIYNDKIS